MNNERPLVCICIPTYNAAVTVQKTLESILSQTYTNLVVHVSDNASTDDTLKIIEAFADSRVMIHWHAINVGAEGNFDRCIQLAEGKYTAIFHADDVYHSDIISKQVIFMEQHQDAGAVFTEANFINDADKLISFHPTPRFKRAGGKVIYCFEEIFKAILKFNNFLICPSAMVRTDILKNHVKFWDGPKFKTSADLGVWLRILEKYKIGILPEKLINYRVSSDQGTAIYGRNKTEPADFFKVIDYYLQKDFVSTLMSHEDYENLYCLRNLDNMSIALNCILNNNFKYAREVSKDVVTYNYFKNRFDTKPLLFAFKTMVRDYCIYLFSHVLPSKLSKSILMQYRKYKYSTC